MLQSYHFASSTEIIRCKPEDSAHHISESWFSIFLRLIVSLGRRLCPLADLLVSSKRESVRDCFKIQATSLFSDSLSTACKHERLLGGISPQCCAYPSKSSTLTINKLINEQMNDDPQMSVHIEIMLRWSIHLQETTMLSFGGGITG